MSIVWAALRVKKCLGWHFECSPEEHNEHIYKRSVGFRWLLPCQFQFSKVSRLWELSELFETDQSTAMELIPSGNNINLGCSSNFDENTLQDGVAYIESN